MVGLAVPGVFYIFFHIFTTRVGQNMKIIWDISTYRLPSKVYSMLYLPFGLQEGCKTHKLGLHRKFLARIPQIQPSQAKWHDHIVIHPQKMTDIFPQRGWGANRGGALIRENMVFLINVFLGKTPKYFMTHKTNGK